MPNYLATLAWAFAQEPKLMAAYTMQAVTEPEDGGQWLRGRTFDYGQLRRANYIDLNVFAHRAELIERYGAFDEQLPCLQDWDLFLRYTKSEPTKLVAELGGIYQHGLPDQITLTQPAAYGRFLIESKDRLRTTPATLQSRPRVLYAVWHYPQLSESYIRAELNAVRKLGVEVEVWSEEDVCSPYVSEVPVHRGSLRDAIAAFKPTWAKAARFMTQRSRR